MRINSQFILLNLVPDTYAILTCIWTTFILLHVHYQLYDLHWINFPMFMYFSIHKICKSSRILIKFLQVNIYVLMNTCSFLLLILSSPEVDSRVLKNLSRCTVHEEKSSSFMDSYKYLPVKFASDSGFILCAASVVKHSNSNKIILIWYQNSE